jgi:hypothetical protein
MVDETFVDGPLSLHLFETADAVRLEWRGMSTAREPGQFLLPILMKTLDIGLQTQKGVVLDFQKVEYLNSSSISPIIRTLEHARRGHSRVCVVYNREQNWQTLSFTALNIFRTPDARIDVQGS